jgi:hypothetical protein
MSKAYCVLSLGLLCALFNIAAIFVSVFIGSSPLMNQSGLAINSRAQAE